MPSINLISKLAVAVAAIAQPVFGQSTASPCATIARAQESAVAANPNIALSSLPSISATLAYQCLTSVPINATASVAFITWYKNYLQFQSTLAWLKKPPPSYQQPATDIIGGLDDISAKLTKGTFTNEYDFEVAFRKLLITAHDGHLSLSLPAFRAFTFRAPYTFISISADGSALPQVYIADDYYFTATTTRTLNWNASPITTINGAKPVDFFSAYAKEKVSGQIEPHGDWNLMFDNSARASIGGGAAFGGGGFFPDAAVVMNITFANGTTTSGSWFARANIDLTGVRTGKDFYDLQVAPQEEEDPTTPTTTTPTKPKTTLTEIGAPYPFPVTVQKALGAGGYFTGYFLNQSSVAVMSIPSFDMTGVHAQNFQAAVATFLKASKAAGMKKLVIDLQGNGGGTVALGFDLFKQIFPTLEPFGGSQLRATRALDAIGTTLYRSTPAVQRSLDARGSPFSPFGNLDTDLKAFGSWARMFGPRAQNGDFMTSTLRNNFSDIDVTERGSGYGIVISGYGNNSVVATQDMFTADNILLVTDGYCASTCTVFAEEMKTRAGVKQLVFGGRPETGPMQAVSGVRGSQVYSIAALAFTTSQIASLNRTVLLDLPPLTNPTLNIDVSKSQFNIRNQVRRDRDDVPLQFVYQAADCRLFYTGAMMVNYTTLWQSAVDAWWGDKSKCVSGSTNHVSSGNVTSLVGPSGSTTNAGTGTTTGTGSEASATKKSAAGEVGVGWVSVMLGAAVAFAFAML
ncbi:hypothetical protein B0J14DRAFT_73417 [Halenospora varia]|nr:hypothetical protein B0J14DRAFT_73417 [Halenospora varia]